MAVLGNLPKLKRTSFWCTFLAFFTHKNVTYLILQIWNKFQYQTYCPSDEIKQYVFKFLFSQWMTSYSLRYIFNHLLGCDNRKREKDSEGFIMKSKLQDINTYDSLYLKHWCSPISNKSHFMRAKKKYTKKPIIEAITIYRTCIIQISVLPFLVINYIYSIKWSWSNE